MTTKHTPLEPWITRLPNVEEPFIAEVRLLDAQRAETEQRRAEEDRRFIQEKTRLLAVVATQWTTEEVNAAKASVELPPTTGEARIPGF